ncbi:hypothetical protein QGN17_16140 [Sphingomonas sp. MAHUQ-71]|uniref:Uncharacterized protein n=1 Tax=Sphingomonas oryzagri TaxID=3042314 RepID=A0ABT6N579_9SPHN|nr:hypothetical protein [Sphingomonas oryzagri]
MKRLLAIFLSLFLAVNLAYGTVAHAMEPAVSMDNSVAFAMGHTPGDADQVPADSDKGYPHHHAGCHGHQIGEPARDYASPVACVVKVTLMPAANDKVAPVRSTPENRPPIA